MTCDSATEKQYICPGESRPISKSVHLARLAAFNPACRDCALRNETGQLSKKKVQRIQQTTRRAFESRLFTAEGVRGVHMNELTRQSAGQMAAAFAQLMWKSMPAIGRNSNRQRMPEQHRPAFVVARDHRVGSPDILVGVIAALLRNGCEVIDIGEATNAIAEFTIEHLNATGGIVVSGAGGGASWAGLDFYHGADRIVDASLMTQSETMPRARLTLGMIEKQYQSSGQRPVRSGGVEKKFHARVPYEAGLLKHFAGNTSRFVVATSRSIIASAITSALPNPGKVEFIDLPVRSRSFNDPNDTDLLTTANAVAQSSAEFGVLVDDDGQRCLVVDHHGRQLTVEEVMAVLTAVANAKQPGVSIVVEDPAYQTVRQVLCDHPCFSGGTTISEMRFAMMRHQASIGGGLSNRYWLQGPVCDAILTISSLLQAVNTSHRPLRSIAEELVFNPVSG